MKTKKWRFVAILAALAIFTGAFAGISHAADETVNRPDVEAMCQDYVSKLAANLGMDEGAVKTALETTKRQMIDEAVQKGTLTQEQADRIAARPGCLFGGFGYPGSKMRSERHQGYGRNLDDMANILGLTADELRAELQSGKKIDEIITGHGMTVEQFQEKMLELKKTKIDQAVKDGKLTQEQADKKLKRLEQCPKGRCFKGDSDGENS